MASIDKINVGGAEYDIKLAPSDTKDDTISFTSNDNSSIFNSGNLGGQSAYAWTAVSKIATGEKHSSLLNKVSTMFKNIRTIAKLIGTTDISSIGNGTLSGGISALNNDLTTRVKTSDIINNLTSTATNKPLSANMGKKLNNDLSDKANASDFAVDTQTFTPDSATYGDLYGNIRFKKSGHVVTVEFHGFKTLANQYSNTVLPAGDIRSTFRPNDDVVFMVTGGTSIYRAVITADGALTIYPYNGISEQNNVSGTFCYIVN